MPALARSLYPKPAFFISLLEPVHANTPSCVVNRGLYNDKYDYTVKDGAVVSPNGVQGAQPPPGVQGESPCPGKRRRAERAG